MCVCLIETVKSVVFSSINGVNMAKCFRHKPSKGKLHYSPTQLNANY
jgi:hypothetical protein